MSSPVSWSSLKRLFSMYSTVFKKDVISLCRIDEDLVAERNVRGSDTDRNHCSNALRNCGVTKNVEVFEPGQIMQDFVAMLRTQVFILRAVG